MKYPFYSRYFFNMIFVEILVPTRVHLTRQLSNGPVIISGSSS